MDCFDLRPWAKKHGYKTQYDPSYYAETNAEAKGDGRWYVEIPCKYGLIYPMGGNRLQVYFSSRLEDKIKAIYGAFPKNSDPGARVYIFPVSELEKVAGIVKPRKRRKGGPGASPERMRELRERRKGLV